MKIAIVVLAWLVLLIASLMVFFKPSRGKGAAPYKLKTEGTLWDLPKIMNGFIGANNDDAFLIIELKNSADFVQFKYYENRLLEIDYPQATERQKSLKKPVLAVLEKLDCEIKENSGTDGTVFIDGLLETDSRGAATAASTFLKDVFAVKEDTELKFTGNS